MKEKFYNFEKDTDKSAVLYIYGDIVDYKWDESDVSAFDFKEELEALGEIEKIDVHINSYGGSTFVGLAIYNLLKQHKAQINVYVDAIAASAASVIAMAGDKIYMPATSIIMIHNCWTCATGNSKELRKTADDMDKIADAYKEAYLAKIKIKKEELEKLLDEESYLTARECIDMGFADEIIEYSDKVVNQNGSKCIFNLINKMKKLEKEAEEKDTTKLLSDSCIDKISKKIIDDLKEENLLNQKKNNQVDRKDSLVESFLNNFIK